MIIVKLMGGLGNQMFQYAAGRHLAYTHNTVLKLDPSFFNAPGNHTPRQYALDIFELKGVFASEDEINSFKNAPTGRYSRFLQRKFPSFFRHAYISESGHAYHNKFVHYPADSYLEGFWQSEKYFLPIADTIRSDFRFRIPLTGLNKTLSDKIQQQQSVSLHIRRGDYVTNNEAAQYHGICSIDYYHNSVEYLHSKYSSLHLFIFSDDIDWVKANLHFDLPVDYINWNTGNNSYIDMQLMSLCKHNIIANSSFSWWAAWLNTNAGKVVIAPDNWFTDKAVTGWKDIYAQNWIII